MAEGDSRGKPDARRAKLLAVMSLAEMDRCDGAVAGVGHAVIKVVYAFVGEFLAQISLVFLADALLSVDVPLLQVRPHVGYLRSAVVYVVWGLRGDGVEEGQQVWHYMPEGMEHISKSCGWLVVLSL